MNQAEQNKRQFMVEFVLEAERYFTEKYNNDILIQKVKPNWKRIGDVILEPIINILVVHAGEKSLKYFLEEIHVISDGRTDFAFECCVVEQDKIWIQIGDNSESNKVSCEEGMTPQVLTSSETQTSKAETSQALISQAHASQAHTSQAHTSQAQSPAQTSQPQTSQVQTSQAEALQAQTSQASETQTSETQPLQSQTLSLPTYFLFYNNLHTLRFIMYKLGKKFIEGDTEKLLQGIKTNKIHLSSVWFLFVNERDNKRIDGCAEEFLSTRIKLTSERAMCINFADETSGDLSLPGNVKNILRKNCDLNEKEQQYTFYYTINKRKKFGEKLQTPENMIVSNYKEGKRLINNILPKEFRSAIELLAYPILTTIQTVLEISEIGETEIEVIPLSRLSKMCMHKNCCFEDENLPVYLLCDACTDAGKKRKRKCVQCSHDDDSHIEVTSKTKRKKVGKGCAENSIKEKYIVIKNSVLEFCLNIHLYLGEDQDPIFQIIDKFKKALSDKYTVYEEIKSIRLELFNTPMTKCTVQKIYRNFEKLVNTEEIGSCLKNMYVIEYNAKYLDVYKPGIPEGKMYVRHSEGICSKPNIGGRTIYKTISKNRGYVLVINNINIKNKLPRDGAERDGENLKELFRQMCNWKFEIKNDLTKTEMLEAVDCLVEKCEKESFDILALFVMSHGKDVDNTLGMYGTDGELVNEWDITNKLLPQNLKVLSGKPKLIFFNSCRGAAGKYQSVQGGGVDDVEKARRIDNVEYKDICIQYSTLMEHKAARYSEGTVYIQVFCEVFAKYAHNTDVLELLSLVSNGVNKMEPGQVPMKFGDIDFGVCYLHPGYWKD